jgi:hypothetical protein
LLKLLDSYFCSTRRYEQALGGQLESKKKKQQEGDSEKAVQHAALPPTSVEQSPADPDLKGNAIVRAIKQELKRVGCYDGRIDEDWQTASAQAAIGKFLRLGRHVTCGSNGCKKAPIGCRAIREPDGVNGRGGKILCP